MMLACRAILIVSFFSSLFAPRLFAQKTPADLRDLSDEQAFQLYDLAEQAWVSEIPLSPEKRTALRHTTFIAINEELLRRMDGKVRLLNRSRNTAIAAGISARESLIDIQVASSQFQNAIETCGDLLTFQGRFLGQKHWRNTSVNVNRDHIRRLADLPEGKRSEVRSHTATVAELNRKGATANLATYDERDLTKVTESWRSLSTILGEKDIETLRSLRILSRIELARQDPSHASRQEQSWTQHEEVYGADHPLTLHERTYVAKALVYLRPAEAARLLSTACDAHAALPMLDATPEWYPEMQNRVNALISLGECYSQLGDLPLAETTLKAALSLAAELPGGKTSSLYAVVENNLGTIYWQWERLTDALKHLNEARRVKELHGRDSSYAETVNQIGLVHFKLADVEKAELEAAKRAFTEARDAWVNAVGKRGQEYGTMLSNLALIASREERTKDAQALCDEALAIYSKYAANSPFVGDTHMIKARLARADNDSATAARALTNAATEYQQSVGRESPQFLEAIAGLFQIAAHTKDASATIQYGRIWLSSAKRFMHRVLPGMTDAEQRQFLEKHFFPTYYELLACHVVFDPVPSEIIFASAEWAINGKALANEAVSISMAATARSSDPKKREIVRELRNVRSQKARLTLQGKEAAARQLEERERDLVREMTGQTPDEVALQYTPLRNLLIGLPPDAALVELARIPLNDNRAAYLAWTVQFRDEGRTTSVRVLNLGYADEIDDAIAALRTDLNNAGAAISAEGEAKAEQRLEQRISRLSNLLIQPIEPHISEKNRWIISPDGATWLIPFEMLNASSGNYLIEDRKLAYVMSGRDLVNNQWRFSTRVNRPVIIGDPDFDAALSTDRSDPDFKDDHDSYPATFVPNALPTNWTRLASFAPEVSGTAALVTSFAGTPLVFTGENASEVQLSSIESPGVLLAVTHGFFRPPAVAGMPGEHAFLRCGLVLAGANGWKTARQSNNDGIVTGAEVLGLNLHDTECVVLSACETGVGDPRAGDGIASLRQAFLLAGAHSVLSSLWKVPDEDTKKLMTCFWQELADGNNIADAMRTAQLMMIAARRASPSKAAHPYYWAAFVTTGNITFRPKPADGSGKNKEIESLVALLSQRKLDQIVEQATSLLANDGTLWQACDLRATARYLLGNTDRAIDDWSRAIQLHPTEAMLWSNRGIAFLGVGMAKFALKDFEVATQLNASHAPSWANRGNAAYTMGQKREAFEFWAQALKLDPDNPEWIFRSASVFLHDNIQLNEAKALVERLLSINAGNPQYLHLRGLLHLRHGELEEASADLRKSLEEYKKTPLEKTFAWEAWDHLGDCLLLSGDAEGAREAWKNCLELLREDAATVMYEPRNLAIERVAAKARTP